MAAANGAHGGSLGGPRRGGDCCSTAISASSTQPTSTSSPTAYESEETTSWPVLPATADGSPAISQVLVGSRGPTLATIAPEYGLEYIWRAGRGFHTGDERDGEVEAVPVQAGLDAVAVIGGCESSWQARIWASRSGKPTASEANSSTTTNASVLGNRSDGVLVITRPRRLQQTDQVKSRSTPVGRGFRVTSQKRCDLRASSSAVDFHKDASLSGRCAFSASYPGVSHQCATVAGRPNLCPSTAVTQAAWNPGASRPPAWGVRLGRGFDIGRKRGSPIGP
jgi:ribosomal protein L13E